jgi:hypothetical protein
MTDDPFAGSEEHTHTPSSTSIFLCAMLIDRSIYSIHSIATPTTRTYFTRHPRRKSKVPRSRLGGCIRIQACVFQRCRVFSKLSPRFTTRGQAHMFLLFESSCNRTRSKDRHTGEYGGCLIQIFQLDVTRRFKHQLVLQINNFSSTQLVSVESGCGCTG